MKPQTIRSIDIWFGKPLCFLLTVARRAASLVHSSSPSRTPSRRILLLKLIEQGATVLAYGAISRAVQMAGRQNVYFLVFEENQEIIHILNLIPRQNVLTIRNGNFLFFLTDALRALLEVRRLRIDAVVDMEFFSRASAILSFLTGAKRRVGLHRFTSEAPYRGDLLTHRLQYNPYIHTSQAYLLLVEALELDTAETPLGKFPLSVFDDACPRFVAGEQERKAMEALLDESSGLERRGPLIILNPNASDMLPLRKWPTDNFVLLGRELLDSCGGATIVVTGAPSEEESAEDICRAIGRDRAFSLAGKTTLRQLLVLYTLADILVTNDSGPAHFASLTDIDSVILFGPETPALFGPCWGRFLNISAKLACSPCVNAFNHRFSPCTDNICMRKITVREVSQAVKTLLARRGMISPGDPATPITEGIEGGS